MAFAFRYDLPTLGHWAFIGGLVLAVLAGFTAIPNLLLYLFVLGLIVGLLNITEKESTPFLISIIALLLIGTSGLQLGQVTELVANILNNFVVFAAAAGLVVAIKQILGFARIELPRPGAGV